jgi:hypothetical protein
MYPKNSPSGSNSHVYRYCSKILLTEAGCQSHVRQNDSCQRKMTMLMDADTCPSTKMPKHLRFKPGEPPKEPFIPDIDSPEDLERCTSRNIIMSPSFPSWSIAMWTGVPGSESCHKHYDVSNMSHLWHYWNNITNIIMFTASIDPWYLWCTSLRHKNQMTL